MQLLKPRYLRDMSSLSLVQTWGKGGGWETEPLGSDLRGRILPVFLSTPTSQLARLPGT